jgi:hypothetical protein
MPDIQLQFHKRLTFERQSGNGQEVPLIFTGLPASTRTC